jgi:hypothetical protein
MDEAKQWTADAIEAAVGGQGIRLAPGRAEKMAAAMNAPRAADPLRDVLPFEADPTSYAAAERRCK